jgi:hypothetical protein
MTDGREFDGGARCAEGQQRAGGLDDVGDGPYVEGLERFMESLGRDATVNDVGRFMAKERMLLHTR